MSWILYTKWPDANGKSERRAFKPEAVVGFVESTTGERQILLSDGSYLDYLELDENGAEINRATLQQGLTDQQVIDSFTRP